MSQEQARALPEVTKPAKPDAWMPNDTSLLLAQHKRQIADQNRREVFANNSLAHPDFLDEITVVSTIGRRTK